MTLRHNYISLAVFFAFGSLLLSTTFVFAAPATDANDLITILGNIVRNVIPIIIGLTFLYFLWGLSKFVLHADDETARTEGKQVMLWGIIVLFVIVSIWGIIALLNSSFIGLGSTPPAPVLPE